MSDNELISIVEPYTPISIITLNENEIKSTSSDSEDLISLDIEEKFIIDDEIKSIRTGPITPINVILEAARTQKEGKNLESSIGSLLYGDIPVFPQQKQISIQSAQLGDQLKSKDYNIRAKAVQELERRIIINQAKCPDEIVDDLRTRTFQLDAVHMSEYLQQPGIFDHNFQDGISCLVDALTTDNGKDINEFSGLTNKIVDLRLRKWITDVKHIGEISSEEFAYSVGVKDSPLFVVKITNDLKSDSLSHEAIVGMGAINKIRNKVPNFMHTYAAFMCSPPILNEKDEIVTWCPIGETKVTYLVLENIRNALSMKDIIKKLTVDEYLQIYIQILNALNVAYKQFDFTHYDLHLDNVLIQELSYTVSIPFYDPRGGVKYIQSNLIPRIIDYGYSHVYLQGQHFGIFDVEFANVYPDKSFPIHDAYKLLIGSYFDNIDDHKDKALNIIYDFFNEGQSINHRYLGRSSGVSRDYYQPNLTHINKSLDDLLIHILDKFELPWIVDIKPESSVSTVCDDNCIQWDTFNNLIFDRDRLPETLIDFCQANQAVDKLTNGTLQKDMKIWLSQFNANTAYDQEIDPFINKLNDTIDEFNKIKISKFDSTMVDMDNYIKIIRKIINILSDVEKHKIWIESAICAFNYMDQLDDIQKDINNINDSLKEIDQQTNYIKEIINFNTKYAKNNNLNIDNEIESYHLTILNI